MATTFPLRQTCSTSDLSSSGDTETSSQGQSGSLDPGSNTTDSVSRRSSVINVARLKLHDRASSDTNLAHPSLQGRSSLTVDRYDYALGTGDVVTVSWDIHEDVGASDWIGLFPAGNNTPKQL